MDIVLSPTYQQDRLMYAYVSTPTDNRVIRIADGDIPKPILTGIPKGATGNMGALIFTSPTTLVVLTGDAGDPALAADPKSLAGKVMRIEQPTTVNQAPQTTALSGMGAGGGLCTDPSDGSLYITDRTPTADRLQRITKDSKVSTVWTWPDKPGVAGCAALDGTVLVNLVNTKQTVAVRLAPDTGAVTGEPEVVRQDAHGHAWALQTSPDGNVWGATVNKTAGDAEKLDDVVFPLFPSRRRIPAQQRRQHLGRTRAPKPTFGRESAGSSAHFVDFGADPPRSVRDEEPNAADSACGTVYFAEDDTASHRGGVRGADGIARGDQFGPAAAAQEIDQLTHRNRRVFAKTGSGTVACRTPRRHLSSPATAASRNVWTQRLSRLPGRRNPATNPAVPASPWLRSRFALSRSDGGSDLPPWRSICTTISGNSQCAHSRSIDQSQSDSRRW